MVSLLQMAGTEIQTVSAIFGERDSLMDGSNSKTSKS